LLFLCFSGGCKSRRQEAEVVVVRILLPPSSSAVGKAITKLEMYPIKTETGKTILPATIVTRDENKEREYLQDLHVFEVLIVPTSADIPATLRNEKLYTTLPCSSSSTSCVAVMTPWATAEERRAADLVLRRLSLDEKAR
jgi:hypothetical protein